MKADFFFLSVSQVHILSVLASLSSHVSFLSLDSCFQAHEDWYPGHLTGSSTSQRRRRFCLFLNILVACE